MRSVNSCRSTKAWSTARFSSSLGGEGKHSHIGCLGAVLEVPPQRGVGCHLRGYAFRALLCWIFEQGEKCGKTHAGCLSPAFPKLQIACPGPHGPLLMTPDVHRELQVPSVSHRSLTARCPRGPSSLHHCHSLHISWHPYVVPKLSLCHQI